MLLPHGFDRPLYWIIGDDGEPVAVNDVLTWGRFFEDPANRIVLQEWATRHVWVSTVFLGLDHRWTFFGNSPPLLWETMIFGGVFDQHQERYATRLAALQGHALAMRLVDTYFKVPRQTKKALLHWWQRSARELRPGERRRVWRALLRIGWREKDL